VIVCSCNVLSDIQILAMLQGHDGARPCSPARAYRGLGCAPRCGRCVPTIRALLAEAHIANCEASCRKCPSNSSNGADEGEEESAILLIAAE
jgi:bacterioferritin-associated ferredoxin